MHFSALWLSFFLSVSLFLGAFCFCGVERLLDEDEDVREGENVGIRCVGNTRLSGFTN